MKLQDLKSDEILITLKKNFDKIEEFVTQFDDSILFRTRINGTWTVKQIIGHLYDTQEVWGERIKQCCLSPGIVFDSYDPEKFVEERDYNNANLKSVLELYRKSRTEMYGIFSKGNWDKKGFHLEDGTITIKDLAETIMAHENHHIEQIEDIKNNKW
ncbi:DinB family protein [Peribacillus butanolivorans]|uniref:DinB family protein n=1 Tax=Peribacillus butanolivorans TaxID=421767 RepID=UPI002E1F73B4|nr:DinB family protein [Peribacillus butanolivorans]